MTGPRRVDPEVAHPVHGLAGAISTFWPSAVDVQLVEPVPGALPAVARLRRPCAARPGGVWATTSRSSEMSYWAPRSISIHPPGGPVEFQCVPTSPSTACPAGPSGAAEEAEAGLSARFAARTDRCGSRREGSLEQSTGVLAVPHRRLARRSPSVSQVHRSQPSKPAAHESACQLCSVSADGRCGVGHGRRAELSHLARLGGRRGQLVVGDVLRQRELSLGITRGLTKSTCE